LSHIYSDLSLTIPFPEIEINTSFEQTDNDLSGSLPSFEVGINSGAHVEIELPLLELYSSIDVQPVMSLSTSLPSLSFNAFSGASVEGDLSELQMDAVLSIGWVSEISVDFPMFSLIAVSGASIKTKIPSFLFEGEVATANFGAILANLPSLKIAATCRNVGLTVLEIRLPSLILETTGITGVVSNIDVRSPRFTLKGMVITGVISKGAFDLPALAMQMSGVYRRAGGEFIDASIPALSLKVTEDRNLETEALRYVKGKVR